MGSEDQTSFPLTARIMSPLRSPPAAAGPPFSTLVTITGPSLTTAKPRPLVFRWIFTGRLSAASEILFVLTTVKVRSV